MNVLNRIFIIEITLIIFSGIVWRSCLSEIDIIDNNPIIEKYKNNHKLMSAWTECLKPLRKQTPSIHIKHEVEDDEEQKLVTVKRETRRAVRRSSNVIKANSFNTSKNIKIEAPEPILTKRITRQTARMININPNSVNSIKRSVKIELPGPILPKRSTRCTTRIKNDKSLKSVVRIRFRRMAPDFVSASVCVTGNNACSARVGTILIHSPKKRINVNLVANAPKHQAPIVVIRKQRN